MFRREEVHIGGESYDFHFREVIPCLRALFGDPRFSTHLVFAPEHHYQDEGHAVQVFSEMYTGKWWWSVQVHTNSTPHTLPGTHIVFSDPWSHADRAQQ